MDQIAMRDPVMYPELMIQRSRLFALAVALFLVLCAAWWRTFVQESKDPVRILNTNNEATNTVVPPPHSASFRNVRTTTYFSPYGYEITYPAAWYTLGLPDAYGDQRKADVHYYFSPLPINEQLHQSLLRPIECDYEGSERCSRILQTYAATDYALLEVLAQQFDDGISMPSIFVPEEYRETAQKIELSDGASGLLWAEGTRGTRIVVVDNLPRNIRYSITIRDPKNYGLDFAEDVEPILSTFRLMT